MSDTCPTCGVKCERLDLHICPKNAAYGGRGMSTAKTMIWHGKEAEHINAVIKAEHKATLDAIKEMRDDRIKRANAVWDNPIGHSSALNELQRQLKFGAIIIDEVINKLEDEG